MRAVLMMGNRIKRTDAEKLKREYSRLVEGMYGYITYIVIVVHI
jgi:hypothetical protein